MNHESAVALAIVATDACLTGIAHGNQLAGLSRLTPHVKSRRVPLDNVDTALKRERDAIA